MSISKTLGLGCAALTLVAGCSMLGIQSSPTAPTDEAAPAPTADDIVEVTVNNSTDADICRIHIRESALNDAYGWSTNQLAQRDNPKPIPAGSTATIKLQVVKPFDKPDLHALDCSGNTVMRVYDRPDFKNVAGASWTLSRADEGTIAAVQDARGIKKSVHPLARQDPAPSGGGIIEISLVNKCGNAIEYCHVSYASSPSSMDRSSSKRLNVKVGDTITLKNGSSCGSVVYTVTSSSSGQEVVICK